MITRNYTKNVDVLLAKIIGEISVPIILQFINYKNNEPVAE